MPGIFAPRQIAPQRLTASGTANQLNPLVSSLDGALHQMSWREARIWEGKGFRCEVGTFSTPVTGGGAGTILDQDQPELTIAIPSGTTLIPIRIHVQTQTPLLATDADESEILIAVDRLAASNASSSTGTVATVYNMRTDLGTSGSLVTAVGANTVNITNPTLSFSLAHSVVVGDVQGTPATALWTKQELLYEPLAPDLIAGPATLIVYWGGTVATTGFCQAAWIEVPTPPTS